MTIALVQSKSVETTGVASLAFTSNTTAGNAIIASGSNFTSSSLTFSDGHNTYTTDKTIRNATGNVVTACGSAPNITAAATTVQCSGTGGVTTIAIYEFSGLATSSIADSTASVTNTGNSTAQATGTTGTSTQAVELAMAFDTNDASATSAAPTITGWTLGEHQDSTTNMPIATAYQIVASTQTFSGTFTWYSGNYAAGIQAYKGAGSGPSIILQNQIPSPLVRM